MIKEEAKVKNFDILHFVADNAGLSTFEAIEKAYNTGVSEQKAILDKIREIVDEWRSDTWTDNLSYECMVKIAEVVAESEKGITSESPN